MPPGTSSFTACFRSKGLIVSNVPDKVAIVTGASSGIGRATAKALAAAGMAVVVNHRTPSSSDAEHVIQEIAHAGGRAIAIAADIRRENQVEAMFAETVERFSGLDLLVNNAGIERPSRIEAMTLANWQAVIDVNLTGQFLCSRAAVRAFLQAHPADAGICNRGAIIFVSSVHETIPWAFQSNYAASKGGVCMLMRSLAQELAPMKIRVNSVAPGAIRTSINREVWADRDSAADLLQLIPYGRIGEAEEVAQTIVWLASDAADYITGASIVIDGGMTLYPAFRGAG
jgi:glucose 1-dehydrogenase